MKFIILLLSIAITACGQGGLSNPDNFTKWTEVAASLRQCTTDKRTGETYCCKGKVCQYGNMR